jgi:arylsulfatase A-like enzyme
LAETLQAAGRKTVIAGTKQVAVLQDRRERRDDNPASITLFAGNTLPPSALRQITDQLGSFPPDVDRKSSRPNEPRNEWTTSALLGPLWTNGVPALTLLWLSEPDSSQHAAGPGSPKAMAAIESSDRQLAAVTAELDRRGLRDKTDIFVVSDHGFSTVEKSVDVSEVLRDAGFPVARDFKSTPRRGDILVVGQGGSVLFYVIGHHSKTVRKLVGFLQRQDFTGTLFTREQMPGAFTLEQGKLQSPEAPDVVLSLRWSSEKSSPGIPGLVLSDGTSQPGTGAHGSLSRFDLHNTLVGAGPDLKRNFTDTLPTGNTDLAPTILWLLGVEPKEPLDGRILSETLTAEAPPPVGRPTTRQIEAVYAGQGHAWRQYLQISQVNQTVYLDEGNAGAPPK